MDCEKYEPLLLDELYEELDEVTSAAVKRHCSGCARCASALNDMRATRRAAVLPMVDLPEGLEDRILAATKEAQKVVPIKSRLSGALSLAGRWAMRPQTAMAAVFLLMIGSSAFVIRARKDAASPAAVSVTEHGAPEPAQASPSSETASLDNPAAAAAHGASKTGNFAAPPAATAMPAPTASVAANFDDDAVRRDLRKAKDDKAPLAERERDLEEKKADPLAYGGKSITNAGAPAGAAAPRPAATAGSDEAQSAAYGAALAQAAGPSRSEAQDGYSAGMASYRARNYADATRQFDRAAQTGDLNSALWAAKSVKDASGCTAALARFESVVQKASGSWIGHEAELEAARCQTAMGQVDPARARLQRLAQVQSHAQQAQAALAELDQVASKQKATAGAGGGAVAAPRAAPAPAKAARPAAKPAAPATAVDNGF